MNNEELLIAHCSLLIENMATCKHKVGILTLRDCKKPAVTKCKLCNRPVCQKHRKKYKIGDRIEFICKECYLNDVEDERLLERERDREYRRRWYYHDTGYRPYYYGHSYHRYRHDDYMYFDDYHHHHHGHHDHYDEHERDVEPEAPEVEADDMMDEVDEPEAPEMDEMDDDLDDDLDDMDPDDFQDS